MDKMESSEDESSSFESRVRLTTEDEDCIRSLGYIIYFDIIVRETDSNKMADQVEKLAATYDRTIGRFNKADSIKYFFFHFAHNFGDFMIFDTEKHVFTDKVSDINDMEDENFTFETYYVGLRVTNKFNLNDCKLFEIVFFERKTSIPPLVYIFVTPFQRFQLDDVEEEDISDQKNVYFCFPIFKDLLKINQSERIAFLKELFSKFYASFYRNYFRRVRFGLPLRSPEYSYASS